MTTLAQLNIREGSNKEKVAIVFLKAQDREAAVKKALALGLQESTARTWCSSWSKGKKAVVNKGKKSTAKKAAPAKAKAKKPAKKEREQLAA
jgi:hypothetical protein